MPLRFLTASGRTPEGWSLPMPNKGSTQRQVACVCRHCGEPFTKCRAIVASGGGQYCSLACYRASRPLVVTCICQQCGNEFGCVPADMRRGGGKYCSRTCASLHRTRPLTERFWSHIDKDGPIPEHRPELGPCWLWTGSTDNHGYGGINPGHGHPIKAHRVSWEIHNGPIPENLGVLHKCDNPPCVNPMHLWLGTHQENMADRDAKGRLPLTPPEKRKSVKLTWNRVREIRTRHSNGETIRLLSHEYDVTFETIRSVVRNESWRE
jgi:hypothetical protein